MRRIILRSRQSPGDILMLTAAVRDLHAAHPGQFETDVRTSAEAIWDGNPRLTKLSEADRQVEVLDAHYPLIHQSNERPYHFVHGYAQYLEQKLGVPVPVTRFSGEVFLDEEERRSPLPGHELPDRFWIIVAGGKYDFTAKWWNPASYQRVVDHFQGKIHFVQCGEAGHWHPPLEGVTNLVGKTSLRQFIRLMHHAAGVVCPVTFAMHLAAAVETRAGAPKVRPCVVIAGGREPTHWEAYPQHQYLSTVGALSCCLEGGCWKSRCQLVGDGDDKDRRNVCEQPVQLSPDLRIPRCLDMITAEDVIRRIELYLAGVHDKPIAAEWTSRPVSAVAPAATVSRAITATNGHRPVAASPRPEAQRAPVVPKAVPASPRKQRVLIQFRHGLGDAIQLTIVLRHLRQAHPDWEIELSALRGKHSVGQDLCERVSVLETAGRRPVGAQQVYALDWDECYDAHANWPSTKPTRCLREVFHLEPNLDLFRYQIARSAAADQRAREYLATLRLEGPLPDGRYPVVLLHYQGNTSCDRKDLPHDAAKRVCETARDLGYVPVILDWDQRSPLIDQRTVFCPEASHPLWGGHGTGDAEALAALIEASALMIGIDSGPLHVAGATTTPTLGVWTRHHPVHFFDLCPNVRHLVPRNHAALAKGAPAVEFFQGHYEHDLYDDLAADLVAHVRSRLTGQPLPRPAAGAAAPARPLTATQYDRQYYEEHQRAGLDYLNFGDWQQRYGRWFVESLGLKGKRVLDVGCACGSILRGLGEAGAVVEGIDLCEHMIQLGRQKWPDMAPLLHVADAADLARYGHSSWEAIHSAQVAEHWSPEAVPRILKELARITVPGGLFFCSLDTEELFARQQRDLATEDPTHICIKPRAWWIEQLARAGWTDVTAEYVPTLLAHGDSFLQKYDWDYFIARKAIQPPRLTVLCVTTGRPTLQRAIESLQEQEWQDGDEVLLVHDGPAAPWVTALWNESRLPGQLRILDQGPHGDWGHTPRNLTLPTIESGYVVNLDDDDALAPRALATIRQQVTGDQRACFMFRATYQDGRTLAVEPELQFGNVGTGCFVHPAGIPLGSYVSRYGGDFDFITTTLHRNPSLELIWRPEVTYLVRPHDPAGAPGPAPAIPPATARPVPPLTARNHDRQYYEEHQRAGLDYLNFGDWQQRYGRWFVESLGLKGKRLLDVGCACGSILRGLGEAGAVVEGIDLSEHMIQLGRQKWPGMAPLLHVADAADLARYGHSSWEALHSAQVAEHWSPEAVPRILKELARITVPGGLFFCSLDTEELFARQQRDLATEDPTHICIKPRAWWIEQLARAGWTDVTAEYAPAMLAHGDSLLKKYDWDYFIARKAPQSLPAASYDLSAYPRQIWDWTPASLDRRHLFWLFDILAAGQFQHALEIGCLNGASSTAFVEALNRDLLQRATFCDIDLRESLGSVLTQARQADRVQTYQGKSIDLLRDSTETFDFVFVDGDHSLENVRQETELLIQRQTLCVMAHDTNVQSFGDPDYEGPQYLKWGFQTTAPYYCLEDNAPRPGEDTGRGLFFATTSLALFEAARASLRTWGQISVPDGLPPPAS